MEDFIDSEPTGPRRRPPSWRTRFYVITTIALGILFLLVLISLCLALAAKAHEAPTGWSYPSSCCSNQDCRLATPGEVKERPQGYVLESTGEVVPYFGDIRRKDSPDGSFHVCQQNGDIDHGRILCLFTPPRAY